MKKFILSTAIIILNLASNAQVITKFNWDGPSAAVGKAAIGPDAVSTSTGAVALVLGTIGGITNYGVSPGPVSKDIDITLPNTSYFNIPAIDISIDFRREESEASFYSRGSNFDFGMNGGKLFVKFNIQNGLGGNTTVNSGNVFEIPNDHQFHNFRFMYDNNTGTGNLWADGVIKYSFNGTPNRDLYWTGATSPMIGKQMDATGRNVAVIDNFELRRTSLMLVLPVNFNYFTAVSKNSGVQLKWSTANENNVKAFVVEKSLDGLRFESVKSLVAKGQGSSNNEYESTDILSNTTVSYRIRSIDYDGKSTFSDIKTINAANAIASAEVSCFPNPAVDVLNIKYNSTEAGIYNYNIYTQDGRKVQAGSHSVDKGVTTVTFTLSSNVPHNSVLLIVVENSKTASKEILRLLRK